MLKLNLPAYNFSFKNKENKTLIFDSIRKKYVVCTPEEWVRQHFVMYLNEVKNYPKTLIAIEKQLMINNVKKRFDIVVFNQQLQPHILIECKAPTIAITQQSFDQVLQYNFKINANYILITNGLQHICCVVNTVDKSYNFLTEVPTFANANN